jgi:hypothetical protein
MKIESTLISKDMKRVILFFGAVIILILVITALYPLYRQQRDRWIVENLQRNVLPFLLENNVVDFVNRNDCKAIKYRSLLATSPVLCTYVNKEGREFSDADWSMFNQTLQVLNKGSIVEIVDVGYEYTRIDDPQGPRPPASIGTAFYIDCFWCRTRYVYWPDYKALPRSWQGDIIYTPINKDWYRVNED